MTKMSDKLDITGIWKHTGKFLGYHSGFVKEDLFLFILPKNSHAVLFALRVSDKAENSILTILDTIEKGSDPNQTVWTFKFGKADYKLESFKDKEEIKISKR